jgi:hypothetical protein
MWVGGVELPADLVDAHRQGRLVLFVGAGASRDSPSDLPDFRRLTEGIAQQVQYSADLMDLDHPDVLLGHLKDGAVDVHLLVAQRLSEPSSSPNHLHEAIAGLALAGPDLRIVTTNFDRHLTTALDTRGAQADEYVAPALPVGNDFTGLVYLHGTLGRPPHRLVLTEDDFGTAYLRDAWAARFLERMFSEFSVLFIGYSHGDVVMRYLARALGSDGHRYVLTDTPDAADWKHLRLRPIGYEVVDGSHAALGAAVARWAEIAGMGLLDHQQRVAELVSPAAPSGIPEDESYLEELIADPERVSLFVKFARRIEWLEWAFAQPVFSGLFKPGAQPLATDRFLASWFVEHFVMNEDHTERALTLLTDSGGFLGPDVWDAIGFHLNHVDSPRPAWLGIWLVLFIRDAPATSTHWLDYALKNSTWPDDREQVLLLLDYLTEPVAAVEPSYGLGPPRLEVHLRGNEYWLQQAWANLLTPNLADAAQAVAAMADRHLRRVRDLQAAARPDSPDWDSVSFRRSGIEPHPQDQHRDAIDVLIDAARDSLETLLDASDPIAAGYLHAWALADSQLLRRLAAHGWTYRNDVDASTKIAWVVESRWLSDHRVRHEVFRLIAHALPDASDDAIQALIAAALEVEDDEPDYRSYERFNALAWMNRYRPEHPTITEALAKAHAVDPTWTERTDPDLTHSMEVGFVPSRPPMSVEDFHERVGTDPSELVGLLLEYKGVGPWEGRSTWEDSESLVVSAVQANPGDGFALLDLSPVDADLTQAVVRGWSRATLDGGTASEVINRVRALDLTSLAGDLAGLLSDGSHTEGHPTDWSAVPEARDLARDLWPLTADEPAELAEVEWLARAINHSAGNLAEFWLHVIQHDWRANEDDWSGLTPEHREALETMLDGPAHEIRTQMADVICASRLHFLFAADADWTATHVLPLLDWSDQTRARHSWNAFTAWGRWSDQMLDAGLMEHYLAAVDHIPKFEDAHQRPFLGHIAGIALTSQRDPLVWLPGVIVRLAEDQRVTLVDKIAEILDELPDEAIEHQWTRWIRQYWEDRLLSIPVQLSTDEAAAMAGWIPFLTDSFEAGAQLVMKHPGRFRQHDNVLRNLEHHVDSSPDTCARVIGHLLRGTERPWWGGHDLPGLMPRLRAGAEPTVVLVIIEEAMRLDLNPDAW